MLECRLLLAGDPPPSPALAELRGVQNIVHDPSRHLLLMPSNSGLVQRYDLRTGQLLEPWDLGEPLLGADLSADGQYLYAGSSVRPSSGGAAGTLFKVRLDTGSAQPIRFAGESFEHGVASVAAVGDGVYFTTRNELYSPNPASSPVRRLDPSTGAVSTFTGVDVHPDHGLVDGVAVRGADRSVVLFADAAGAATWEPATKKSWSVFGPGTGTHAASGMTSYGDVIGADAAVSRDGSWVATNPTVISSRDFKQAWGAVSDEVGIVFHPQRDLVYRAREVDGAITVVNTDTGRTEYEIGAQVFDDSFPTSRLPGDRVIADDYLYVATMFGAVHTYRLFSAPAVSAAPAVARPGQAVSVTVSGQYLGGSVDTTYRGTVTLNSTDPGAHGLPDRYTFTAADGGTHAFRVTFGATGTQRITAGDAATGLPEASADVEVDGTGPTASAFPGGTPAVGTTTPYRFPVKFTDPNGVDRLTLGEGDVEVLDPHGSSQPVRLIGIGPDPNATGYGDEDKTFIATYEIAPPGGRWEPSDGGTYTLRFLPDAVADKVGNFSFGDAATFTIPLPATAPDLVVSAAADWSELAYVSQRVKVTATVRNLGTGPATGQTTIELVASEDAIADPGDIHVAYSFNVNPPGAGESRAVEIEFAVPSVPHGGLYHLLPTVTNAGDANPDNNAGPGPVVPLAAPYADPVVRVETAPPAEARRGSVVAVRVLADNLGSMPARGGWGLQLLRDVTVDPAIPRFERVAAAVKRVLIKRGGSRAMTFRLKLRRKLQPGTYVLAAGFGPADSLSDWNRQNSVVAGPLRVTG
jgi:hypothetical protein